jgi:hypothetical protein
MKNRAANRSAIEGDRIAAKVIAITAARTVIETVSAMADIAMGSDATAEIAMANMPARNRGATHKAAIGCKASANNAITANHVVTARGNVRRWRRRRLQQHLLQHRLRHRSPQRQPHPRHDRSANRVKAAMQAAVKIRAADDHVVDVVAAAAVAIAVTTIARMDPVSRMRVHPATPHRSRIKATVQIKRNRSTETNESLHRNRNVVLICHQGAIRHPNRGWNRGRRNRNLPSHDPRKRRRRFTPTNRSISNLIVPPAKRAKPTRFGHLERIAHRPSATSSFL